MKKLREKLVTVKLTMPQVRILLFGLDILALDNPDDSPTHRKTQRQISRAEKAIYKALNEAGRGL